MSYSYHFSIYYIHVQTQKNIQEIICSKILNCQVIILTSIVLNLDVIITPNSYLGKKLKNSLWNWNIYSETLLHVKLL